MGPAQYFLLLQAVSSTLELANRMAKVAWKHDPAELEPYIKQQKILRKELLAVSETLANDVLDSAVADGLVVGEESSEKASSGEGAADPVPVPGKQGSPGAGGAALSKPANSAVAVLDPAKTALAPKPKLAPTFVGDDDHTKAAAQFDAAGSQEIKK